MENGEAHDREDEVTKDVDETEEGNDSDTDSEDDDINGDEADSGHNTRPEEKHSQPRSNGRTTTTQVPAPQCTSYSIIPVILVVSLSFKCRFGRAFAISPAIFFVAFPFAMMQRHAEVENPMMLLKLLTLMQNEACSSQGFAHVFKAGTSPQLRASLFSLFCSPSTRFLLQL